jgi:hypothetical protein
MTPREGRGKQIVHLNQRKPTAVLFVPVVFGCKNYRSSQHCSWLFSAFKQTFCAIRAFRAFRAILVGESTFKQTFSVCMHIEILGKLPSQLFAFSLYDCYAYANRGNKTVCFTAP